MQDGGFLLPNHDPQESQAAGASPRPTVWNTLYNVGGGAHDAPFALRDIQGAVPYGVFCTFGIFPPGIYQMWKTISNSI